MYEQLRPIAIRLLRGESMPLTSSTGQRWRATAFDLTEEGEEPFIESDAFEVARAIVVMELRDAGG